MAVTDIVTWDREEPAPRRRVPKKPGVETQEGGSAPLDKYVTVARELETTLGAVAS